MLYAVFRWRNSDVHKFWRFVTMVLLEWQTCPSLLYSLWPDHLCCPEIGTSSIYWAQQSRSPFYLMTETDSCLRNVVCFLIKYRRWIMSKKFVILEIYTLCNNIVYGLNYHQTGRAIWKGQIEWFCTLGRSEKTTRATLLAIKMLMRLSGNMVKLRTSLDVREYIYTFKV
jgi:hypothetical protein